MIKATRANVLQSAWSIRQNRVTINQSINQFGLYKVWVVQECLQQFSCQQKLVVEGTVWTGACIVADCFICLWNGTWESMVAYGSSSIHLTTIWLSCMRELFIVFQSINQSIIYLNQTTRIHRIQVSSPTRKLETHMHSLEANASPAGRLFAAKCPRRCHIPVAFQDIGGGSISSNVATPNLVSLRRPSVPFVLPNFIDIC